MKTLTLYNSLSPMFRNPGLVADPFEILDRFIEAGNASYQGTRNPAVDVSESDSGYLIEVELPGLSEKDLKLEYKDGILSLSTAIADEKKDEKVGNWLRRERREFRFARSFAVPEDANAEAIEAKLKDGLLSVHIAKKPATAPRLVPVKAA